MTASLLRGTRAIVFDNLSEIDSGPLAAALTSGVWRDRVLGYSREVTLPIRNAWDATGNNMRLSDEQARRAVAMFLDPGETRPSDRPKDDFRHPDLLGWARKNRPALAEAALTLVRNWLDGEVVHAGGGHVLNRNEGVLSGSERTLGSFERWAGVGVVARLVRRDGVMVAERRSIPGESRVRG